MGLGSSIEALHPDRSSSDSSTPAGPTDLPALVDAYERALILASLAAADGHQRRAARMLGIGATTLNQKMKRLRLRGVALLPTARGFAPAPASPLAGSAEEFRWRGRLPKGHGVEVRAVNGDISVEPGVGDEVEVVAQKRVHAGAPTGLSVEIVVSQTELGLNIAAHYATPATAEGSSLDPELAGPRHFPPPEELRVNFRVRVPLAADLDARTLNGDIEVHGLAGRIRLESARGRVSVSSGRPR